ncbi:MAG TPA: formate dehydrogenase [Usitatibacter sp.]|nr:formate dehydrogenase [Usitatibacter sp.]
MKTTKTSNRRKFLVTAGLGSAGAVAAVVAGTRSAHPRAPHAAAAEQCDGYRLSEHVLKYYKTTEV